MITAGFIRDGNGGPRGLGRPSVVFFLVWHCGLVLERHVNLSELWYLKHPFTRY